MPPWARQDRETFATVVHALEAEHAPLTKREAVVVWLRCVEGLSAVAIAERMCVSVKTVESHQRNVSEKLGRGWVQHVSGMYQYQLGLSDGLRMGAP